MSDNYDAVVVGSGPNGLAAAITLARAGCSVLLVEARGEIGGGCRSASLTSPGFVHDVCSAVHPLAVASPFFRSLPLERYGLQWIQPDVPLAHPLDGGKCVLLHRSVTAQRLELARDGAPWSRLFEPLADDWEKIISEILQPLLHFPPHPLLMARFGRHAVQSASYLARRLFETEAARALLGGLAAHSFLDLRRPGSAATGLVLGILAHATGWPIPQGGAGKIALALGAHFEDRGGKIITNWKIENVDELPSARGIFLDVTARQVLQMAAHRLPPRYCERLRRFRYGPAVFKVDFALSSPIPWKNADCSRAGTVHLGGSLEEIEQAEGNVANGRVPDRPFVLLAQPSLFDPTRAPEGRHTAWAYCHIPHACEVEMTARIEAQIERFAPGFRDCIIAHSARGPRQLEADNANLVGGDINGGLANLGQMIARPVLSRHPYQTPRDGLFICSASTPPGGGVHGMSGYHATDLFLRKWSR